jgi:amino acid adenylation domain-containing protein
MAATDLIHELISEQALRCPDGTAVIFREERLTYRELVEEAEQLSAYLRHCGIGPESIVAVCLERSLYMIVALFAVLKAGGAYLPLDPAFPSERVGFMLDDSRAAAVVTQSELARRFEGGSIRIVLVDKSRQPPTEAAELNAGEVRPDTLAYLMYTSGSTGRPKGVMVEHRNVVNFFAGMDQVIGREAGVWLAVTSISFDISVLELLWTLARGFTVVMEGDEDKLLTTGRYSIPEQIRRHDVTHLQCTPTLAAMLVRDSGVLNGLKPLHKLLLGGEALPLALADRLSRTIDGDLHNMYGPTETTIWSTAARIAPGEPITIGRPIANTQIYMIDEGGGFCPPGVVGELCIGGAGVARGYWERPELTAERFVKIEVGLGRPARLYKTGDLARYLPDGNIEFLGRIDNQVKVRGYRVELGEVEAVLGSHPAVHQVVVSSVERPDGDGLAAYVVTKGAGTVSAEELRILARRKLPEYMIPSAVVFMAALPTTPNGKIDRAVLPAPTPTAPTLESNFIADRSSVFEKKVAAVFRELLGIEAIGLHQNFFDLGATSLTVAEAGAVLGEALGREVKLTDLFTYPTVGALAAYLNGDQRPEGTFAASAERGFARRAALEQRGRPSRRERTEV